MMAAPKQKRENEEYFRFSYGFLPCLPTIYAFTAALYAPEWLTWHFGPLGTYAKYCVADHFYWTNLLYNIIIIGHICEGFIAWFLCRSLNMSTWTTVKWFVLCVGGGIESLFPLVIFYVKNKFLKKKQK